MFRAGLLIESLADNPAALPLRAEKLIKAQASEKAVVSCRNLQVEYFARQELCQLVALQEPAPDVYKYWGGEEHDRLYESFEQVVWDVQWNDVQLKVIHLEWETGCGGSSRDWVVADSKQLAENFILEVERHTHSPGDAILVFRNGDWQRSTDLYDATQSASFEDLVLADDMKTAIQQDFMQFLESEERYNSLGIAWRRGALMIGPPGNGKTHCVRALVNHLNIASLYVQSLKHPYFTVEQMWERVFDRARGLTPCILILEDLDTLVDAENRSFFLNQLDGFQQNHGLIVLGTTNYPERIDSAIVDRPSRFDRKYHFKLPTLDERKIFLASWQPRLVGATGWQTDDIQSIAEETELFSFAYLKELVISAVLQWMQQSDQQFSQVLKDQAAILKKQMKTD